MSKVITAPNPQGKGVVGVLVDLQAERNIEIKAKDYSQILADYFTSSLIYVANYSFKPVTGVDYYLYLKQGSWQLSLIEPQAWKNQPYGEFFARCVLNDDKTWSLLPCDNWMQNSSLKTAIDNLQQDFVNSLNNDDNFLDQLPFYQDQLNYYQRVGAYALACSLRWSLYEQYGQQNLSDLSAKKLLIEGLKQENLLIKQS
jgi:hypothetical protein